MGMKRIIAGLGLVVVVGLLGWLAWRRMQEAKAKAGEGGGKRGGPGVVAVEVEAIRRGPIRDVRLFTGTLEPRARYVIAPKIAGRLEAIAANLGDRVSSSSPIARLDDEEHRQQVAQARAAIEVARATAEQQQTTVDLAARERDRVRRLWERQATSEMAWDAADAEYKIQVARHKVALAQMAEQDAALKGAEVRLSYARITLPQDTAGGAWFVAERHVDEGEMLAANTPLLTVVDLARMTAVIHVIERDYAAMHPGLVVELETDAYPGRRFAGTVARIAPALQAGSRQARVEIEVANDDLFLRPGMFVRASIEFARREDAILAPRAAVVVRDGRTGLFLADPATGTARFRTVTVDLQSGPVASLSGDDAPASGLAVTLGHHLLSDGTPILLPDGGPPAAPPDAAKIPAGK